MASLPTMPINFHSMIFIVGIGGGGGGGGSIGGLGHYGIVAQTGYRSKVHVR